MGSKMLNPTTTTVTTAITERKMEIRKKERKMWKAPSVS